MALQFCGRRTRYISPEAGDIERLWQVGGRTPMRWVREVFPGYPGAFIRAARDSVAYQRELVVGQWALIPWFAKERKLKFPTRARPGPRAALPKERRAAAVEFAARQSRAASSPKRTTLFRSHQGKATIYQRLRAFIVPVGPGRRHITLQFAPRRFRAAH